MLYTYDVDIEATSEAPKDTTQATRIPDMPFKATQENLNGKSTIVPKINLTKDLIQYCSLQQNNQSKTSVRSLSEDI